MSRVAHPNIASLLAARVLPPGKPNHEHSVYPCCTVRHVFCYWRSSAQRLLCQYWEHGRCQLKHAVCDMQTTCLSWGWRERT